MHRRGVLLATVYRNSLELLQRHTRWCMPASHMTTYPLASYMHPQYYTMNVCWLLRRPRGQLRPCCPQIRSARVV